MSKTITIELNEVSISLLRDEEDCDISYAEKKKILSDKIMTLQDVIQRVSESQCEERVTLKGDDSDIVILLAPTKERGSLIHAI